jgi:hypothetical protein
MEIHRDDPPEHLGADLEELLAEDQRVSEQGLRVTARPGERVVEVRGTIATAERRDAVGEVLAEHLPGWQVVNQVDVLASDLAAPASAERVAPEAREDGSPP